LGGLAIRHPVPFNAAMTRTHTRLLGIIVGLLIAIGVLTVENRIEQRVRGNVVLHWLSLPGGYELSHQTTRSGWGVFWYSPDGVSTLLAGSR
jgi:hypothetical protein